MSKQNELVQFSRGASGGGSKNIIINGAMTIAQRNTAAHNEGNGYFALDRWYQEKINHDQFTYSVEQVSDAPSGFSKSLKVTTSTAETALASDEYSRIYQAIEGNNFARVGFGTADAKPLSLSFWVKSSITGNWSASLYINDANVIYSQAYTINSANTWEYKTLSIPAYTTAGPNIDNTSGAYLNFGLFAGSGSNTATTAWTSYVQANLLGGQTANLGGTLNATWQITGVQLEVNDNATDFEHENYGTTLAKCERYYHTSFTAGQTVGTTTNSANQIITTSWNDGNCNFPPFPNTMRAAPTITLRSRNTTNTGKVTQNSSEKSAYVSGIGTKSGEYVSITSGGAGLWTAFSYECDAEL
jgi:hypothetical protein